MDRSMSSGVVTLGQGTDHGQHMSIPALLRIVAADCPRMQAGRVHDVCGVNFPGLVRVVP